MMIQSTFGIAEALRSPGYYVAPAESFLLTDSLRADLEQFSALWDDLREDDYLPPESRYRFRRFARFTLSPELESLELQADTAYYQSAGSNRLFGGMPRTFAPLSEKGAQSSFLRSLLLFNLRQLPGAREFKTVQIHLVRIVASTQMAGEPSPEGVHSDGFDFISMHLIRCRDVVGGETQIYTVGGDIVAKTTLTNQLDSVYINDQRFLHFTSGIRPGPATAIASRDMLLVSYEK